MPKLADEALEARRREIIAAAIRCFARSGLHATTMRDIFREAGLSAGAVYNYYQSKDEIVAAVVDANSDASLAVLSDLGDGPVSPDAFMGLIDLFLDDLPAAGADGRACMAQLIVAEAAVSPALGAKVREKRAAIRALAARRVAALKPHASEEERERLLAFVFHLYEGMLTSVALGEPVDVAGMRAIIDKVVAGAPEPSPA